MAKVSDFLKGEDPLTGKTTSIFDFGSIFQRIIGVVVLLFVVSTAQNVAKLVQNKSGGRLDTTPGSFRDTPAVTSRDITY